ncbi:MAG: hypothetical protein ABSF00_02190 [Candidatus Bathyarchaeia archaeon]
MAASGTDTETVTNGFVPATSRQLGFNGVGNFNITTSYSGDSRNKPVNSLCEGFSVTMTILPSIMLAASSSLSTPPTQPQIFSSRIW